MSEAKKVCHCDSPVRLAVIELGQTYRDTVLNIVGVATCRAENLNTTPTVRLTRVVDGTIKDDWFEESQLVQEGATVA